MTKEFFFLLGVIMLLIAGVGYLLGVISKLTIPILVVLGLIFSGIGASRANKGGDNRETLD